MVTRPPYFVPGSQQLARTSTGIEGSGWSSSLPFWERGRGLRGSHCHGRLTRLPARTGCHWHHPSGFWGQSESVALAVNAVCMGGRRPARPADRRRHRIDTCCHIHPFILLCTRAARGMGTMGRSANDCRLAQLPNIVLAMGPGPVSVIWGAVAMPTLRSGELRSGHGSDLHTFAAPFSTFVFWPG